MMKVYRNSAHLKPASRWGSRVDQVHVAEIEAMCVGKHLIDVVNSDPTDVGQLVLCVRNGDWLPMLEQDNVGSAAQVASVVQRR